MAKRSAYSAAAAPSSSLQKRDTNFLIRLIPLVKLSSTWVYDPRI
jgi:hypothetical protein